MIRDLLVRVEQVASVLHALGRDLTSPAFVEFHCFNLLNCIQIDVCMKIHLSACLKAGGCFMYIIPQRKPSINIRDMKRNNNKINFVEC